MPCLPVRIQGRRMSHQRFRFRQSKIAHFGAVFLVQQNIGSLQIAMVNSFPIKVFHTKCNIGNQTQRHLPLEGFRRFLVQHVRKLPLAAYSITNIAFLQFSHNTKHFDDPTTTSTAHDGKLALKTLVQILLFRYCHRSRFDDFPSMKLTSVENLIYFPKTASAQILLKIKKVYVSGQDFMVT